MKISKIKILSYVIVFALGMFTYHLFHKCPEIKQKKEVAVLQETSDTSTTKKEISFKVPAQIKIKRLDSSKSLNNIQDSGSVPSPAVKDDFVACLDTTMQNGFEAHVCYDSETNHFFNRFIIPETKINNEKIISVDNTKEIIKTELPEYVIGIGVRSFLKDNTINTLPFLSLAANKKLWFMIGSIEVKALTRLNAGALKMEPEVEGKIYVPL